MRHAKVIRPEGGDIDPPVITYSAAGVSHAEISREAVMLGENVFNSFWPVRGNRELTHVERADLGHNSVGWSKKVRVYTQRTEGKRRFVNKRMYDTVEYLGVVCS